jgi:UDP-N-acetylglucosamine 2-epimerase (non-hydrolysing)
LKILAIYGTRPEAIKMAPVVAALRRLPEIRLRVCASGQHREMVEPVERLFGFRPDIDLALMRPDQTLNGLAAAALSAFDRVLEEESPDWLLVQGDTTTAMAAATAAFHRRVRVAHVEAGLRTGDLAQPFPEELNRRIIDLFADALFAPTLRAVSELLAEGAKAERVHLVGNTVVDALASVSGSLPPTAPRVEVLVTVHRRESFGVPLLQILAALRRLAERFPEVLWVYPVHRNPNVAGPAREILAGLPNLELHEPFDYRQLLERLSRCRFVLTDSGGLQEEAPSLGKPVLVLRETTERPEGIEAGVARLVGVETERIVREVSLLLTSDELYRAMARPMALYGDGKASERIAAILTGAPWSPFELPVEFGGS